MGQDLFKSFCVTPFYNFFHLGEEQRPPTKKSKGNDGPVATSGPSTKNKNVAVVKAQKPAQKDSEDDESDEEEEESGKKCKFLFPNFSPLFTFFVCRFRRKW